MNAANPGFDAAMRLYRAGRLEEALAAFDALLASNPGLAPARSLRGLTRCHLGDFAGGISDLREAVRMAPREPAMHANLGMVLFVQDQLPEANEVLRKALVLNPRQADALSNLSLVLRAQGDFGGAERAARAALAARPGYPEATVNLGYALVAQGKFAEGWEALSFRPHPQVNLRDPGLRVTVPHDAALPPAGTPAIVHGEQGLGDTLFLLRFAPQLRARGHRLAFWGDARLHPLLARTGLFEHHLRPEAVPGAGLAILWAGDLPRLLGASDPAAFPPPLALTTDPVRLGGMRARLAAWGPAPYVGITWRAGLERKGKVALAKEVPPRLLGAALAPARATFVSVQRNPRAEEWAEAAQALGAPLHDAGFANEDLDDALAIMALLDDYVGVSNTNMHLRAGLGRRARVLVPFPPEWRWLERAERSPWFPHWPLYRQSATGDWSAALEGVRAGVLGAN